MMNDDEEGGDDDGDNDDDLMMMVMKMMMMMMVMMLMMIKQIICISKMKIKLQKPWQHSSLWKTIRHELLTFQSRWAAVATLKFVENT